MKLLAVGDIHLGRLPAALPPELASRARALGPEQAWQRTVTLALERQVEAVLLAGDVVDRSRDFFVSYAALADGIRRLADAGIEVLAVAGNHDTEVLPRLAGEIDGLHLLGAGGRWQVHALSEARIIGWSFPTAHVHANPLTELPHTSADGLRIGLLHCDRDQIGSSYAPVPAAALEAAGLDAWLLGHVHQPDPLDRHPIGYLGALTALRASDTGARGPWLVTVEAGALALEQIALAPLRYESLALDVEDLKDPDELHVLVVRAIDRLLADVDPAQLPDALGLRLTLTGRCASPSRLTELASAWVHDGEQFERAGVTVFIQKVIGELLPQVDLSQLAAGDDPLGLLARRLVALETPSSSQYAELIEAARPALEAIDRWREFSALPGQLDDQAIAQSLRAAGRIALERLLAQRRDPA